MDNLGMWVVILILAYAVYRLWDSSERESERHHDRIYKLEWKVEHLEENVFAESREIDKKLKEIEDEALEIWGVKSYRELEGDERKKFFEWIDDANQRFYADLREKEQQANRES
jgi:hypothetical protein